MRWKRPDVPLGLGAFLLGWARRHIVVIGRSRRNRVLASHAESQLLRAYDRRAFRACSENQRLQRCDFRAKSIILPLQREHYFSERGRISRKVFRSKRHKTKLTQFALNRQ